MSISSERAPVSADSRSQTDDMVYFTDYARGPSWPPRSADRPDEGVDVAERSARPALRHHHGWQHRLVCRRKLESEHGRAVRPCDRAVSDVGDRTRRSVVRHMVAAPDGSLWLACSEVDTLARVEMKASPGTR